MGRETGRASQHSPVVADGLLYVPDDDGITYVVKAGPKFEVVSRNELGEKCYASPAVSRGQIFMRTLAPPVLHWRHRPELRGNVGTRGWLLTSGGVYPRRPRRDKPGGSSRQASGLGGIVVMTAVVAPRWFTQAGVAPRAPQGEGAVLLTGIRWETSEASAPRCGDRRIYLTYDRGMLEIMAPMPRGMRTTRSSLPNWSAPLAGAADAAEKLWLDDVGAEKTSNVAWRRTALSISPTCRPSSGSWTST